MKNEELNLAELLKDCPKGTKLYSPIFGEVELESIDKTPFPITIITASHNIMAFTVGGCYTESPDAECLLFPSKDQRDWNVWKAEQDKKQTRQFKTGEHYKNRDGKIIGILDADSKYNCYTVTYLSGDNFLVHRKYLKNCTKVEKFDPKWLKPFDRVLCRHSDKDKWKAHFFSHINTGDREYPFYATFAYRYCIPYNLETKHLVGTTEEAPEFYINWQE